MVSLGARAMREIYRRELLPSHARWWLAAAGMRDWFRILQRGLKPHLNDRCESVLRRVADAMFARRWAALGAQHPSIAAVQHDEHARTRFFRALYRSGRNDRTQWLFASQPQRNGVLAALQREPLLEALTAEQRWREVATHLGELLIVMTEQLPAELPHARKIFGDICFNAGERYARHTQRLFGLREPFENPPALAIEVLRISEYIFHVNPDHWGRANANDNTGTLEGTACLWWSRPGWNGAHCGIFGQFQSGVCSAFGLRYHLAETIPKHGGNTCRVEIKPIPAAHLARRRDATRS